MISGIDDNGGFDTINIHFCRNPPIVSLSASPPPLFDLLVKLDIWKWGNSQSGGKFNSLASSSRSCHVMLTLSESPTRYFAIQDLHPASLYFEGLPNFDGIVRS